MPGLGKRLLGMAFALLATTALAAGNPQLGQQKAAACVGCHGPDGNSVAMPAPAEPWPKLAGQVPEYIAKQLHDFKSGRRSNAQMSPMAQSISDADISDIAAYFAAQKSTANPGGNAGSLAAGEKLFLKGKGRPDIVMACIGCHGPSGAGNKNWNKLMATQPAVLAPAIGGQHANYLVKQLKDYKEGKRTNDTAQVMRNITARLSDQEIEAVSWYVASLNP